MKSRLHFLSLLAEQQGIALLVVLWVMTMLTIIVGQFCYSARSEINSTRNFRDSAKAYYHARAGIQQAIFQLIEPDSKVIDERGQPIPPHQTLRVNVDNPQISLEDGSFSVRIGNTSGQININLADKNLLTFMFVSLELDDKEVKIVVDSILDWRDADNFHRINGAENDYYQTLPEPYSCQNGPFRAKEDLLLVRGMTKDILSAIRDVITIYPKGFIEEPVSTRVRKTASQPVRKTRSLSQNQKQLNINAAGPQVLSLFPFMNSSVIQDIADFRQEADFRSLNEVRTVVGNDIYRQLSRYITLDTSSYYTLTATGLVADSQAKQTVFAIVDIDADHHKYEYVQWLESVGGF